MANEPEIITRYLKAADARDADAVTASFTEDGTVTDEGKTYHGRDEIRDWRENNSQFDYTTAVTGSDQAADGTYRVTTHIEGNFPGGAADLSYAFTLRDGLIADLTILQ